MRPPSSKRANGSLCTEELRSQLSTLHLFTRVSRPPAVVGALRVREWQDETAAAFLADADLSEHVVQLGHSAVVRASARILAT